MTPSVHFDHVWKKFRRGEMHTSLRDFVPAMAKRLTGGAPPRDELGAGDFWATHDVSFSVEPGQALGIIGPNGAGKSTILKLLTRILRPTRGVCTVQGRVGSLIEIAAGFHPDLTGRENVFLQGAIMGMSTADIRRKFEQIVDFAGISDFIDTPVKRYSSGMNARLGFGIAAHLDPDILIVDEVLAVGDFAFQAKAFGRIRELVRSGMPVVVVSHQLDRIAELCTHAMLLSRGSVQRFGTAADCISAYVLSDSSATVPRGDAPLHLAAVETDAGDGVASGEHVEVRIRGEVPAHRPALRDPVVLALRVRSAQNGQEMFCTTSTFCGVDMPAAGQFEAVLRLQMNVSAGIYGVETFVWEERTEKILQWGPSAYVQVRSSSDFWGPVQMNARMTMQAAVGAPRDAAVPPAAARGSIVAAAAAVATA